MQRGVLVAATMQAHVEAMFEGLGIGAQMSDPRLADTKSRIANKDHVLGVLMDAFRTNTARHWSAELGKRGVPIAEVRTIADAVTEPQLDHRGTLVEVPAPQGFDGPVRLVGPAYTAAADGPVVTRTPPGLGDIPSRSSLSLASTIRRRSDEMLGLSFRFSRD